MFIDPGQTLLVIALFVLGIIAFVFKIPRYGKAMIVAGIILAVLPPPSAQDIIVLGYIAIAVMIVAIVLLILHLLQGHQPNRPH